MMNYHEMTMDEPRSSPARKQQYLVICVVMFGMFAHSFITAGGISALDITESIFPGGDFVYRFNQRDYASTFGLFEEVAKRANVTKRQYPDLLYALYLDDPSTMNARRIRFGTGILVGESGEDRKDKLLAMNPEIEAKVNNGALAGPDITNMDRFRLKTWEVVDLPSVDAAVLQFPHTGGFVSALLTAYRIIPALRRYAVEKGEKGNLPVVMSTCSVKLQMCTHYAPLVQSTDFLLGQPESKAYHESLGVDTFIDWEGVMTDVDRFFPFVRRFLK